MQIAGIGMLSVIIYCAEKWLKFTSVFVNKGSSVSFVYRPIYIYTYILILSVWPPILPRSNEQPTRFLEDLQSGAYAVHREGGSEMLERVNIFIKTLNHSLNFSE